MADTSLSSFNDPLPHQIGQFRCATISGPHADGKEIGIDGQMWAKLTNWLTFLVPNWLNFQRELDIDDSDFWLWTDEPGSEPASLVSAHASRAESGYKR